MTTDAEIWAAKDEADNAVAWDQALVASFGGDPDPHVWATTFTRAFAPPGPLRIVVPASATAAARRTLEEGKLLANLWLDDVSHAMRRGTPLDVLRESQRLRESVHPGRTLCRAQARELRSQVRRGRR